MAAKSNSTIGITRLERAECEDIISSERNADDDIIKGIDVVGDDRSGVIEEAEFGADAGVATGGAEALKLKIGPGLLGSIGWALSEDKTNNTSTRAVARILRGINDTEKRVDSGVVWADLKIVNSRR